QFHSQHLAEAIAGSSLSREEKMELFVLAAGNKSPEHQYPALLELKKLDAERHVTLLIVTLENFPRSLTLPTRYHREIDVASLVLTPDDPRAWQALERATRRADLDLRMALLNNLASRPRTLTQRRRQLAFFSAFLEDDTVYAATLTPERSPATHA